MSQQTKSLKRVVVCCSPGNYQHYLINLIHQQHSLVGVVLHKTTQHQLHWFDKLKKIGFYLMRPWRAIQHIHARYLLKNIEDDAFQRLIKEYPDFENWGELPKDIECLEVDDINHPKVLTFIEQQSPDIVLINGTNLIRKPLLSYAFDRHLPFVNFHSGLSPYARGGNCNLFCFLKCKPQWVGGTIHFIDKGIDSGKIIHSFQPPMQVGDSFELIEGRVFLIGMQTMSKLVDNIVANNIESTEQWTKGKLFLSRTGYRYEPRQRLKVNHCLLSGGLQYYLENHQELSSSVILIDANRIRENND